MFFADYEFYLYTSIEPPETYNDEQKNELLAANQIVKKQNKIIKFF